MVIFYETDNFIVYVSDKPHVIRTDGGHIVIKPKVPVESRWDFSPELATELMRLSMIVGEAMKQGLNNRGIPVERINFQDNCNWAFVKNKKPFFHLHLYGRSKDSKIQRRGQALSIPDCGSDFFNTSEPLNAEDIEEIKRIMDEIMNKDKYKLEKWGFD
jgi:diadenosine tetraphosphate (Ap4A) HIT family hydrolase